MNEITRHPQDYPHRRPASGSAVAGRSLNMIRKVIWEAIGFVLFVVGSIWMVGAWIETLKGVLA